MLPIHTRISTALADPSTWPSIGAVVTAAAALEGWPRSAVIVCGIIGILLKGGNPPEAVA